jgi:NifU-like protein involved in Fe-S cluster formation
LKEEWEQDPEILAKAAEQLGVSERFLDHALSPRNVGILPHPEGFAHPKGACGDFIELYLRIQKDVIDDARFLTQGCAHTVACGSAMTELIKGLSLAQAVSEITAERVEDELGGLPKEHKHCAALAAATLRAAIRNFHKDQSQASWKKPYRRA